MGTSFFKANSKPGIKPATSMNMEARAIGANAYAAKASGQAAQKDLGALAGLGHGGLKPTAKTAASNAPGPKKV